MFEVTSGEGTVERGGGELCQQRTCDGADRGTREWLWE